MGLIFGDESDTVRRDERDVFVYAFLSMSFATYEDVQACFWDLRREKRIRGEVKWSWIPAYRASFLEMLAAHPVKVRYFVVDKTKLRVTRQDRYRYKALETAFSGLFPMAFETMPLVLLDERQAKQNHEEAKVLMALGTKWRSRIPAYAYLPSDRVPGLQLVDLVAGAMRSRESRGDKTWEILKSLTTRCEV